MPALRTGPVTRWRAPEGRPRATDWPQPGTRRSIAGRSRPAGRPTARRLRWCARCTARYRGRDPPGDGARGGGPGVAAARIPGAPAPRRAFLLLRADWSPRPETLRTATARFREPW